jgi:hypothetical protein
MKISKAGGPKDVSSGRKKEKASDGDGEFADRLRETHGAGDISPTIDGGGVGAVGSVFALQEVPNSTDGQSRKMLRDYGSELLDRLEDLRIGILNGSFSKDRLAELAQNLRKKRQGSDDSKLNEIIAEIELRAEVEIAKLTRR